MSAARPIASPSFGPASAAPLAIFAAATAAIPTGPAAAPAPAPPAAAPPAAPPLPAAAPPPPAAPAPPVGGGGGFGGPPPAPPGGGGFPPPPLEPPVSPLPSSTRGGVFPSGLPGMGTGRFIACFDSCSALIAWYMSKPTKLMNLYTMYGANAAMNISTMPAIGSAIELRSRSIGALT
ncbi:hypothetical protein D3248_04335 [Leucobacter zeae]|nr:hypothetical protein [Leucobacter zeae]